MNRSTSPRGRAIAASLMLAATLIAACGGGDDAPAASGEVVLYTSIPAAVVDRLEGVIEQRFPDVRGDFWVPVDVEGISLRVVRGRTADIQRRIAAEIERGRIEADLIWLAEPSPYATYKELGVLAAYDAPPDAPISPDYVDPDGYYTAGRIISMVVAWNRDLHPDPLTDWPDLADAQNAAFPAPQSGAARATIAALLDLYGPGFFTTLAETGGVSVPSNGDARDGLIEGRFDAVGVLDYMAREANASGSPIDFAYPKSGTVLIPSPIAITADARNPSGAGAVVDFILSQRGQEIIVEIGSFYPVRTDVSPPAGAPALDVIESLDVDWVGLADEVASITSFWEEAFGAGAGG